MNGVKYDFPPFELGRQISGRVIIKIVKNNSVNLKENDNVTDSLHWQLLCIETEISL